MPRETCETYIFAHLYRQGREPLNVPIRLHRVPCIGEFLEIEGQQSWWSKLGLMQLFIGSYGGRGKQRFRVIHEQPDRYVNANTGSPSCQK